MAVEVPGNESPARVAKRLQRRGQILDAAAALFEARGFEGTTTDDIAEAANVTKRTLYRHVGSKEELLFQIHESFVADLLADVSSSTGTPEQRFRAMVRLHIRDLAENVRYIKVFFEEIKHLDPGKRKELFGRRAAYENTVNGILADGVEQGAFQVPDVRLATRAILGAMNEGYRWYRGEPRDADATADLIAGQFLYGLEARTRGNRRVKVDAHLAGELPSLEPQAGQDEPLDRILEAATKLFSEKGYHRTNTQEIAAAAGMTKGALFYHVGYKEEALVQIQERFYDRATALLRSLEEESTRASAVLAQVIVVQSVITAQDHDAVAVVSEEMKYLPPEAVAKFAARQAECQEIFERTVRRGVAEGDLMTDDPHVAALIIQGMINSTYRWYRRDAQLSSTELGLALADLTLHGISARSPSRR